MEWAEFKLRLIAFERCEIRQEYKDRRLSWVNYIAPHQDPKKLRGMTEQRFWKIGKEDRPKVSKEQRERFFELTREYLKKKNG